MLGISGDLLVHIVDLNVEQRLVPVPFTPHPTHFACLCLAGADRLVKRSSQRSLKGDKPTGGQGLPRLALPGPAPPAGAQSRSAALRTPLVISIDGSGLIINTTRAGPTAQKALGPGWPHFLLVPRRPARCQVRAPSYLFSTAVHECPQLQAFLQSHQPLTRKERWAWGLWESPFLLCGLSFTYTFG